MSEDELCEIRLLLGRLTAQRAGRALDAYTMTA